MSEGQSGPGVGDRPQSILFVCTGNICRSPIAERILRTLAGTAGVAVTVTSAGVGAQNGAPMHPLSVEVLDEHGYDAAGFEAHYLRPQILDGADLVLTMTREHRAACQRTTPARWKRMFTLNEFVELVGELDGAGLSTVIESRARIDTNAERLDIVDPMGQPKEAFERVFAEIEPRVLDVASWLAGGAAVELPGGREPEPVPVEPVADDGTPPPEDPGSASSGDDTPDARWWRNRWLWIVLGVLIAVVVFGVAWLAYSAFAAKGELESARTDAQRARTAILDGDQETAKQLAQSAADEAGSAADRTDGVVWSAAAAIPWLGKPLDSVTQISSAVSDYASQVLVPSADLSSVLSPSQLRRGDTISTAPLRQAQPQLAAIAEKSDAIATRAAGIDPSWSGTVADARNQLVDLLDRANTTVQGTDIAAQLVPSMLGADGPRNYILALQTPSESRGTGGLVGGFAIINATDGRVTAPTLGANSDFRNPARPQIDLGQEYDWLFDSFKPYTDFRNSNLSPNFPDAARIWIANWKSQTGQQLDGAVALDPIAMSYVLKVTGPVTLPSGEKITADNIVPITLSTAYQRFADNNDARKAYLQSISRAVVGQISGFRGDTGALLEALGRGVHERRIMVYSADPVEQKILESTDLGHQIPDTSAPYLQVALSNAAGNKLDYYLRREISYQAAGCSGDSRKSTVTVTLTNTLDNLSLPDYVVAPNGTNLSVARGTNLVNVAMLTTKGATVTSLTVDGVGPLYTNETLNGRPYVSTLVRVPPGQKVTVTMNLEEPTSAHGPADVPIQPLVDTPQVKVDVPACR